MKKSVFRALILYVILTVILITIVAISIGTGAVDISLSQIIEIIFNRDNTVNSSILLDIRLPRVLLAGIIGAGLAAVGAVMQGIFRNPLVDTYTLGMSSGAALGAVISIVTGVSVGVFGLATSGVFAFIGAVVTLFIVYSLAYTKSRMSTNTLLLAGVAMSFFLSSVISFLMMLNHSMIQHIVFWTMGSLATATWRKVIVAVVTMVPGIFVLMLFSRELNMMALGEESAKNLGVNTTKVKIIMLITGAIVVGGVVSTGGTIGFVGLIAPHIIRFIMDSDNKKVIPMSALFGAIIVIASDTVGRTIIQPAEIPVGIMTSLLGGPFFIYLLRRQKQSKI